MFNFKAIVMFIMALVLGTSAAYMAYGWIENQAPTGEEIDPDFASVFVAAREIPYGQSLDKSHLKVVSWPREQLPKGAILASEDIEGKLINQSILPGELLMSARLSDKLPGSRLSSVVTPKKRAITVRVNDVAGVAGFLLPGNRVDVLATRMENRRAETRTLLQNIRVLAIDQKANAAKDDPIVVRAVTLEADLAEASLLASATEEGTIQLVLRNPEDHSMIEVPRAKVEPSEPAPDMAAAKPANKVKRKKSVTIIRGTNVANTHIRQ